MALPFTPAQLASIHQTEMSQNTGTVGMCNVNNEARADVKWQETLQSAKRVCEDESNWESDGSITDPDEPVGLFGLQASGPCLVMTRKYTLWPHTCTYVECQVICPDAQEGESTFVKRCLIWTGLLLKE